MWNQINISLKGKVTVINILAASLLVYRCIALDTPIIKETETSFLNCFWNDLECFLIDMTWLKRTISNPTSLWKLTLDDIVGLPFEYLLRCTVMCKFIFEKLPPFDRNTMLDLNTVCNNKPNTISEITHETLFQ